MPWPEDAESLALPELLTAALRQAGVIDHETVIDTVPEELQATDQVRVVREWLTYDSLPKSLVESVVVKRYARGVSDTEWLETEREVRFFGELRHLVLDRPGLPRCHFASMRGIDSEPTVVLGDLGVIPPPDPVAGCSPDATLVAIDALVEIHAAYWNNDAIRSYPWLVPLDAAGLQERRARAKRGLGEYLLEFGRELPERTEELLERAVAGEFTPSGPSDFSLLHGAPGPMACHVDGVGRLVALLGWNSVSWGDPTHDLAWLLGGVLSIADRRVHEGRLLAVYREGLQSRNVLFDEAECQAGYSRALVEPLLANVAGDISEHLSVVRRRAAAAIDHHFD